MINGFKEYTLAFVLFFMLFTSVQAQKTDSLKSAYDRTSEASAQLEIAEQLIVLYFKLHKKDSASLWFSKTFSDAERAFTDKARGAWLKSFSDSLHVKGALNPAIQCLDSLISYYRNSGRVKDLTDTHYRKGLWLLESRNLGDATSELLVALRFYEESKDSLNIARCKQQLGLVENRQGNPPAAIALFSEALEIFLQKKDSFGLAGIYTRLSNEYSRIQQTDSASHFYKLGFDIVEKQPEKMHAALVSLLIISANVESGSEKTQKQAFAKIRRAIRLAGKYNDTKGLYQAQIVGAMAAVQVRDLDMAEDLLLQALDNVNEDDKSDAPVFLHYRLSQVYEMKSNHKKALHHARKLTGLLERNHYAERTEATERMKEEYNAEKREQQILLLSKDKAIQKHEIEKRNQYLIGGGLVGLLILAMLVLTYRANVRRRKTNKVLQQKNDEINVKNTQLQQQKEEILTQNEELQQQQEEINTINERLEEQFKEVQSQNLAINDSIRYARTIQEAVLPHIPRLKANFQDSFVLYKPQHIVSGDFFWFRSFKDYKLIAVGDCTGHGVPGAFMSLLGMSSLDHILTQGHDGMYSPAEMLEEVNRLIVFNLRQEHTGNRDGMELIICRIEAERVIFSASKRPLFVAEEGKELLEYKGTRRYIGSAKSTAKNKPFEECIIERKRGMMLYLTSDGFQDQLNNERKRFGSRAFKQLLQEIAGLPAVEQEERLNESFLAYQEELKQIDDVTVLGVRL